MSSSMKVCPLLTAANMANPNQQEPGKLTIYCLGEKCGWWEGWDEWHKRTDEEMKEHGGPRWFETGVRLGACSLSLINTSIQDLA